MLLVDITPRLEAATPVYPGDDPVSLRRVADTAWGDPAVVSTYTASLHVGAHIDAPCHIGLKGGVEAYDVERFFGPCIVVEMLANGLFDPMPILENLTGMREFPSRVLFKTRRTPAPNVWTPCYAHPTLKSVEWLVGRGVRLLGIDTPSFDAFEDETLPVHRAALGAGAALLENLELSQAAPGVWGLSAFPLPITGADAAPVRAVLYSND